MPMQTYEEEARAREADISYSERRQYLAKQYMKYSNAIKVCKNEKALKMLENCRRQTLKLLERV